MPMAEPDAPIDRRIRGLLILVLAAFVLAGLVAGGRHFLDRRTRARDDEAIGRLNEQVAVRHVPLSDADFEEVLGLCVSAEPEVRQVAVNLAAAGAYGWGEQPARPDRAARVFPVAARLLTDPESRVRRQAIKTLRALKAKDQVEAIRPLLQAADSKERGAAEEAMRTLTGPVE
jgi:hypothetical protein